MHFSFCIRIFIAAALLPSLAAAHGGMDLPTENRVGIDASLLAVSRDDGGGEYVVPGFVPGGEAGPPANGLSLSEAGVYLQWHDAEHALSATIEAAAHGGGHADAHGGGVEIEQAWVAQQHGRYTALLGRQFAPLGLRNMEHGVAATFPETSLAYRVFLGGHYRDDGVALRVQLGQDWLLGAGTWRGAFPAGGEAADGVDAFTAHLDGARDFAGGGRLLARLSLLATRAAGRYDEHAAQEHSHDPLAPAPVYFSGNALTGIASLQWFSAQERATALLELFARREDGDLHDDALEAVYDGEQAGVQAELLWSPVSRWRVGLRQVVLGSDNIVTGAGAATLAAHAGLLAADNPTETSAVLEWRPDAWQTVRLQWVGSEGIEGGDLAILQYAFHWEQGVAAGEDHTQ